MSRGFTLLEVIIALLLLEVVVVGTVSTLLLSSSTLTRAETIEHAAAAAEGVLDSLARAATSGADSLRTAMVTVRWTVDDAGNIDMSVTDPRGESVLEIQSVLPVW